MNKLEELKKPSKLKRSESFLGIHFDFHAREQNREIGQNTTTEMIEAILEAVRPDYLQCDCKGHPGFSSYPTQAGYPAPGLKKDALRIWREVTEKYGVSLYMHYSGVWDTKAIKENPSWARIDENGGIDPDNTSVFGPYVDKLLIPQLKELCDEYNVDGVWIDGDCWATCQEYSPKVVEAFISETGIRDIPRKAGDPYYYEYTQFCRKGFKKYLKHYVDELHKHNSNFEIASNWAFSSFMPEPVDIDVDFLSGDFSLQNSVNSARLEGRCLTRQGKPWDLMAWSFSKKFGEGCDSTKSATQLCQEAAVVLALGGGFQAYFKQKSDGSVSLWPMEVMREVSGFCRERQSFCHKAEAVPQIALLYPETAFYKKNKRVYGAWSGELVPMQGILQALLDSRNSVEILMNHHIKGRMEEYPLIILPEWDYLEPGLKEELSAYVRNGGKLLLIGPGAAQLFQEELKIEISRELKEDTAQWISHKGRLAGVKSSSRAVRLLDGAVELAKIYGDNDFAAPIGTAASCASLGEGMLAAVYLNLGERYANTSASIIREFLNSLVRQLFPEPMVEVFGRGNIDVVINKINGCLAVSLVNTSGPHSDSRVYVYDEVPEVGPLDIRIRCKDKPAGVRLEPEGVDLEFSYEAGVAKITVEKLKIYSIIVVK